MICGKMLVVRKFSWPLTLHCERLPHRDGMHGDGSTTWYDEDDDEEALEAFLEDGAAR